MSYTNVEDLDDALAALNAARDAFRPDFCPIHLEDDEVQVSWIVGGTREINSANTVTRRAARTVNEELAADPTLRLVDDHRGRWVAIRTA